jgi:hypothetical protein
MTEKEMELWAEAVHMKQGSKASLMMGWRKLVLGITELSSAR